MSWEIARSTIDWDEMDEMDRQQVKGWQAENSSAVCI